MNRNTLQGLFSLFHKSWCCLLSKNSCSLSCSYTPHFLQNFTNQWPAFLTSEVICHFTVNKDPLSWPTLRTRRKISRLQLLHKILHQDISLSIPPYYQSVERQTRHYHPLHFILPTPSTTSYQQSFYSRSIKEWNELPVFIIEMTENYDEFTTNLISHFTNNQHHIS